MRFEQRVPDFFVGTQGDEFRGQLPNLPLFVVQEEFPEELRGNLDLPLEEDPRGGQAGERVVVDGGQRLSAGAAVAITQVDGAPQPGTAASAASAAR